MIRKLIFLVFGFFIVAGNATARDTRHRYSIDEFMKKHGQQLEGVAFYFGDQEYPAPEQTMAEYQSNKKTNAANKSDREACEWALLSALLQFKKRAQDEGGNAVVGIWSNYKRNRFSSETEFECGAGAIIAGVTMKGTVVRLPD